MLHYVRFASHEHRQIFDCAHLHRMQWLYSTTINRFVEAGELYFVIFVGLLLSPLVVVVARQSQLQPMHPLLLRYSSSASLSTPPLVPVVTPSVQYGRLKSEGVIVCANLPVDCDISSANCTSAASTCHR